LRYFVAVAAHGSFNRAAKVLHLSQPALSHQIKDLEAEMDVRLLVRSSNSITLTAIGESFYEDARAVLAHVDKVVERARGERGKHVVRVGYISAAVSEVMPAALEKFRAAGPRVRIELADLSPGEMKTAAQQGRLDILILPETETRRIPGYQWTALQPFVPTLVMSAKHPLAQLKKIAPTRVRDLPLIGLGGENFSGYASDVRAHLRPFGVIPQFVAIIEDGLPSLLTAVEANHAAAVLGHLIEPSLPRNLVMRPFSPALKLRESKIMVGISEDRTNLHAAEFARILCEQAERLCPKRRSRRAS
jgi:DNA-binding transcriptional LysR family regulator